MDTLKITYMVPKEEFLSGVYLKDKEDNNYFMSIEQDFDPENPRDYECLSHMVCWMKRVSLGDVHNFDSYEEFKEYCASVKNSGDEIFVLPLYAYIHSGICVSTKKFNDYFDSGMAGYIYVLKSEILNEGIKETEWKDKAVEIVNSEIKVYNQFLEGDVYGYRLFRKDGDEWNEVDSCWGFYGDDINTNGMLDQVGLELRSN